MSMNMSIGCDAKTCKHHHLLENYCTLDHIEIDQSANKEDKLQTNCKQFKTN